MGFLGITEIEVVSAEGVAMGTEARAQAIDGAIARIEEVCAMAS